MEMLGKMPVEKKYNFIINKNYSNEKQKNKNEKKSANPNVNKKQNDNIPTDNMVAEKFNGIRNIKTNYILSSGIFDPLKVEQYSKDYEEENHFFAPLFVTIKDNKFFAEGNVEILYVAKNLGFKNVLCRYGTRNDAENENKYRKIGTVIKLKDGFIGTVYKSTPNKVYIVNPIYEKRIIKLDYHIKKELIEIIENGTESEKEGSNNTIKKALKIYRTQKNKVLFLANYYVINKGYIGVEFVGIKNSGNNSNLVFHVFNSNTDIFKPYLKELKINMKPIREYVSLGEGKENNIDINIPLIRKSGVCMIEFYVKVNEYIKSDKLLVIFDFDSGSIEIRKRFYQPEAEKPKKIINIIDGRSFVIRANNYNECTGHNVESVNATIDILTAGNEIKELKVQAYYCYTCGIFYLKEEEYFRIKRNGKPICQILTWDEYKKLKNRHGYKLNAESILKSFGYSAAQKDHLSEKRRRAILEVMIEKNILTKIEVIDYLRFFIRYHPHAPKAIEKWQSDIAYLDGYKKGNPLYIKISKIIQ